MSTTASFLRRPFLQSCRASGILPPTLNAIIDNQKQRLALRLRDQLEAGAVSARLAVGYLFLDGLGPLRAQIDRLESLEILIGNVVNRLTEEQVREESSARMRGGEAWVRDQEDLAATLRESHDRAAAETALSLRATLEALPHTAENQALLLTLARRVAQGNLRVRLYTLGRIHAKVTLVGYAEGHPQAPGMAIVGSSNLTLGGEAHPTELNVVLRDRESLTELGEWFDRLWDVSQDFHRELFDELGACWAFQPLTNGTLTAGGAPAA